MDKDEQSFCCKTGNALDGVNINTTSEVIKEKYDSWANKYDQDMVDYQYTSPAISVRVFMEITEKNDGLNKTSKICDVGAGTGVIGELLKKEGYTNVHAIDISPRMLDIARGKGCYQTLVCGGLGNNTINISNVYDAVLCIGCITVGHIKPSGLDEMVDMVRPGGLLLFTLREDAAVKKELGYVERIKQLVSQEKIQIIYEEKIDYLSVAGNNDPARNCILYGCLKK